MDYKLAKQLKDAGYPQGYNSKYDTGSGGAPGSDIRIPTLSELILACGDGFRYLGRVPGAKSMEWFSSGWNTEDTSHMIYDGYGNTPEESIAGLWLALNKK